MDVGARVRVVDPVVSLGHLRGREGCVVDPSRVGYIGSMVYVALSKHEVVPFREDELELLPAGS